MRFFLIALILTGCYSLSAQEWTVLTSLPEEVSGRNHPVTFAIGGKGYVGLGQDDSYNALDDFYRYEPDTDTWTQMPAFEGGARSYSYGVTHGIKAYIGFGSGPSGDFNDLWEYNPLNGESTELASLPTEGRTHPTMVASEGIIYVGLGGGDNGNLDDWWGYNIADDEWTELAQFPGDPRHHPYYFAIDGLIYTGFGHGDDIYRDWYQYDPVTDEWTQLNDIPAEGRVAGTQFDFDGKGYVLSGQGEDHSNLAFGEFWEYDPLEDSWVELEAHPGTGRWAPGSFIIENQLYFTCGESSSNEKDLWSWELVALEAVGLEDLPDNAVEVSVNPASGVLLISSRELIDQVAVFDMQGRLILSRSQSSKSCELNLTGKAGTYIVSVSSAGTLSRKKVAIH